MDKLAEIMAHKRREIAPRIRPVTAADWTRARAGRPAPPPFAAALARADGRLAIIAEIKRHSPSAGTIKAGASAVDQAVAYHAAGADALSVLTDGKFFGGSLADLKAVTDALRALPAAGRPASLPCLRKDFMIHPWQVLEALEGGASAILIIVRALSDDEIQALADAANAAGMAALFEVHNEAELQRALRHRAEIIGVNNRDLTTFKADLALTERLIPQIPAGVTAVSESGIFTAADAARARAVGAHAILVGEALMKAADVRRLVAEFRDHGIQE